MVRKLPVPLVVIEAFALPWARRELFVRALAVPATALVAIEVGWWLASDRIGTALGWAAWAVSGILWIILAVTCHRLVLLDPQTHRIAWVPGWGRRETLFLVWIAILTAAILGIVWVAVTVIGTIVGNISKGFFEASVNSIALVIGTYLFARFAFVLPATAIDARTGLATAWRQTRGNGWRMVVIVGVLPWVFGYAARLAGGDEPGIVTGILVTVFATALLPVEISALSLSYRELATPDS